MLDTAPLLVRHGPKTLALSALAAALLYALAAHPRPLVGAALWGLLVLVAFAGWGTALARWAFPGARVDVGLRAAWGAGALAFVGAVLAASSALRGPVAGGLVLVGVGLAAAALARPVSRARPSRLRVAVRFAKREPVFAFVALLAASFVALHYLGAVAEWRTDPQRDDPGYLGLVRKLLDTGAFPEPFGFHRASALGAQTVFMALVASGAGLAHPHIFDRGVCLVLVVALVVGYRAARTPPLLFRLAGVAFLLLVPSVAVDTASYFSGVAFFFALVRTLAFLDRTPARPVAAALPVALLGAAACALRHVHAAAALTILAVSYGLLVARRRARWTEAALALAALAVALAPWLWMMRQGAVVNDALVLHAPGVSLAGRLFAVVKVTMEGLPIRTLPLLFVVLFLLRDAGARRPVWALIAGFGASFLALMRSPIADQWLLARYAFGCMMATALVAILESGVQVRRRPVSLGRATIAAVGALSAVLVELLESRQNLPPAYARTLENIDAARADEAPPSGAIAPTYGRAQAAVPAGARALAVVDEAAHFDYARNPLWVVDLPGFTSVAPGQPFFQGSAALEEYLRAAGVRYVVFVRPERSRYQFRRSYWIGQMTDEHDPLRPFGPYVIDMVDALADLAARRAVIFEEHGVVTVDLGAPAAHPR